MSSLVKLTDVATGQEWVIDTRPDPLMRDDAWTTADGRELSLGQMDQSHIENVIRYLRLRTWQLRERAIQRMLHDLQGPFAPSGDMACDAFDYEFDGLIQADPREWLEDVPIIRALKAELVMRCEPWGVAA